MSQKEVLDYMQKHKEEKLRARQIARALGKEDNSVRKSLNQLARFKLVNKVRIEDNKQDNKYYYELA